MNQGNTTQPDQKTFDLRAFLRDVNEQCRQIRAEKNWEESTAQRMLSQSLIYDIDLLIEPDYIVVRVQGWSPKAGHGPSRPLEYWEYRLPLDSPIRDRQRASILLMLSGNT